MQLPDPLVVRATAFVYWFTCYERPHMGNDVHVMVQENSAGSDILVHKVLRFHIIFSQHLVHIALPFFGDDHSSPSNAPKA